MIIVHIKKCIKSLFCRLKHIIKWALNLPVRIAQLVFRLLKSMVKPSIIWMGCKVLANHRLRALARNMLAKHPKLKHRLLQLIKRPGKNLSSRAERIYVDIKKAIYVKNSKCALL